MAPPSRDGISRGARRRAASAEAVLALASLAAAAGSGRPRRLLVLREPRRDRGRRGCAERCRRSTGRGGARARGARVRPRGRAHRQRASSRDGGRAATGGGHAVRRGRHRRACGRPRSAADGSAGRLGPHDPAGARPSASGRAPPAGAGRAVAGAEGHRAAPGTEVPTGSPAIVVVSSGPDLGTVPDVVGRTLGQATAQISQAGFRVRAVRVASSDEEGTVVAQNPVGGARANRGTVVRLNVSRRSGGSTTMVTTTSSQATVPDTVGQDEATAQAILEGAGFTVRVVDQPTTSTEQDGIVVRQAPAGGGTARTGSTVSISVGRLS